MTEAAFQGFTPTIPTLKTIYSPDSLLIRQALVTLPYHGGGDIVRIFVLSRRKSASLTNSIFISPE
jgi:hypothetical protein